MLELPLVYLYRRLHLIIQYYKGDGQQGFCAIKVGTQCCAMRLPIVKYAVLWCLQKEHCSNSGMPGGEEVEFRVWNIVSLTSHRGRLYNTALDTCIPPRIFQTTLHYRETRAQAGFRLYFLRLICALGKSTSSDLAYNMKLWQRGRKSISLSSHPC